MLDLDFVFENKFCHFFKKIISQNFRNSNKQIGVDAWFAELFIEVAGIAAYLPCKPRDRQILPVQLCLNHIPYMNFAFHLLFFTKVISTQKEAQSLQGLQKKN